MSSTANTEVETANDVPANKDALETKKAKPGERWQALEEHVLPNNNLPVVMTALMLSICIAAMDQTIVATALPTIVGHLGGGARYSWVGSAYLLGAGAVSPLLGKLSDILGRKPFLYVSISLFVFGSALCGAAQNLPWLIACRAIQGLGGGAIIQMVNIVVGDIVSLQDRGKMSGLIGATWGISSVIGPLVGGALTDHASWRWCFYINLPIGGGAAILLFFFLKLNPRQGKPWREHVNDFDFVGFALMIPGVIILLLGFTESQTSWSEPKTIAMLTVGLSLLVAAGINECYTTRSPILPPRLFKARLKYLMAQTRTTALLLISSLFHIYAFMQGAYYLPLYYQVLGASATMAGVKMIAYSFGGSFTSATSGFLVAKTGKYKAVIIVSFAVFTLGTGLMIMLDERSSIALQEILPLIAALGMGPLFQTPLIALQAAMPMKDMATSTAAFGFVRTMGGGIGIAVGQAIIGGFVPREVAKHPELANMTITGSGLTGGIAALDRLPNDALKTTLQHVYTKSISWIWILNTPLLALAFLAAIFLRVYSLQRTTVQAGEKTAEKDVEKGEVAEASEEGTDTTTHAPSGERSSHAGNETKGNSDEGTEIEK
ncbi:MFS amino acid permease [Flagelloscypha sp. PMI_526]|nr:MFS amino acid permease [Flagelloscypha sp. PMI_526]